VIDLPARGGPGVAQDGRNDRGEKPRGGRGRRSRRLIQTKQRLASLPPEIKPLSRAAINYKASSDAKDRVFDTIGKLAGLTVIYDPDFPARRISVELNNVTLEQALEIVSLESKAFIKPVTENIIFVIPESATKAQGLRRAGGKDILHIKHSPAAGFNRNCDGGSGNCWNLKRLQQLNSQECHHHPRYAGTNCCWPRS